MGVMWPYPNLKDNLICRGERSEAIRQGAVSWCWAPRSFLRTTDESLSRECEGTREREKGWMEGLWGTRKKACIYKTLASFCTPPLRLASLSQTAYPSAMWEISCDQQNLPFTIRAATLLDRHHVFVLMARSAFRAPNFFSSSPGSQRREPRSTGLFLIVPQNKVIVTNQQMRNNRERFFF